MNSISFPAASVRLPDIDGWTAKAQQGGRGAGSDHQARLLILRVPREVAPGVRVCVMPSVCGAAGGPGDGRRADLWITRDLSTGWRRDLTSEGEP